MKTITGNKQNLKTSGINQFREKKTVTNLQLLFLNAFICTQDWES